MKTRRARLGTCLVLFWFFAHSPAFALLPFPLYAGQRGLVACLDNRYLVYDVYLPPTYATNASPLPILYTFNPSGYGMVSNFQTVCANLRVITIGLINSRNGTTWDVVLRECHAVSRDIRQRVLYDPTAEFASGFSGGAVASYMFARFRPQHVAGVYAMGGWLGRSPSGYMPEDQVQTNLLVARSTGTSDTAALYYLTPDSNFLASCGTIIQDYYFNGGHATAPDDQKTLGLTWLLTNRVVAGPNDRTDAQTQANDWQARITAGEQQAVLREAVTALMTHPRSWFAYQAQLILDQLMTNTAFCTLEFADLARGDFANNHFYFTARGAALNGDTRTYYASLKALTGIFDVTVARAGGVYSLLQSYGYAAPRFQFSAVRPAGQLNFSLTKDTPGLTYSLQLHSNLVTGAWQTQSVPVVDTNTSWSASAEVPAGLRKGFYRINTTPTPTSEPAWP